MYVSGFGNQRSLTGGKDNNKPGMVATVKSVDKAPNINEQKVKIKVDGARTEEAIYVPKKYSKNLKPERKYEFHLEETTFRGGGDSRLNSASNMTRRTKVEPTEVRSSGMGGRNKSGGGTIHRGSI